MKRTEGAKPYLYLYVGSLGFACLSRFLPAAAATNKIRRTHRARTQVGSVCWIGCRSDSVQKCNACWLRFSLLLCTVVTNYQYFVVCSSVCPSGTCTGFSPRAPRPRKAARGTTGGRGAKDARSAQLVRELHSRWLPTTY